MTKTCCVLNGFLFFSFSKKFKLGLIIKQILCIKWTEKDRVTPVLLLILLIIIFKPWLEL